MQAEEKPNTERSLRRTGRRDSKKRRPLSTSQPRASMKTTMEILWDLGLLMVKVTSWVVGVSVSSAKGAQGAGFVIEDLEYRMQPGQLKEGAHRITHADKKHIAIPFTRRLETTDQNREATGIHKGGIREVEDQLTVSLLDDLLKGSAGICGISHHEALGQLDDIDAILGAMFEVHYVVTPVVQPWLGLGRSDDRQGQGTLRPSKDIGLRQTMGEGQHVVLGFPGVAHRVRPLANDMPSPS